MVNILRIVSDLFLVPHILAKIFPEFEIINIYKNVEIEFRSNFLTSITIFTIVSKTFVVVGVFISAFNPIKLGV